MPAVPRECYVIVACILCALESQLVTSNSHRLLSSVLCVLLLFCNTVAITKAVGF